MAYMVVDELILIINYEGTQPGDWGCDQCFGFENLGVWCSERRGCCSGHTSLSQCLTASCMGYQPAQTSTWPYM